MPYRVDKACFFNSYSMFKRIVLSLLAVVPTSLLAQQLLQAPMSVNPRVSGSFAELRSNHFHSGLDLSTQGVIGVPVVAADDGYVSRIKVSTAGYGRIVYLDHPNGTTTAYAHLSAYAPFIDSLVKRRQYAAESFEIEIFPPRDSLLVKRGQVIALSGNSGGSGGPHLHFEVRDTRTEEPMNPLAFLPAIADNVAPVIYGIKLYALNDSSSVGNAQHEQYLGKAALAKPVNAYGNIGVAVHATDFFVPNGSRCGATEIKLFDGDSLIFHESLNRFAFSETRYANSFMDYAEWQQHRRFLQKSFIDPGNKLSVYRTCKPLIINNGELHHLRYEVYDFVGHKSIQHFSVSGKAVTLPPTTLPANVYKLIWNNSFALDTLGISINIGSDALYSNALLQVGLKFSEVYGRNIYTVGSGALALHTPMHLTLPVPVDLVLKTSKLYVAQVNAKGALAYAGGSFRDGKMHLDTKSVGRFMVAADEKAPRINIKLPQAARLSTSQAINVSISDYESGIASYRCEIDGVWKLFEYDYKTTLLHGNLQGFGLAKGAHTLRVVVTDRCGNESITLKSFTIL